MGLGFFSSFTSQYFVIFLNELPHFYWLLLWYWYCYIFEIWPIPIFICLEQFGFLECSSKEVLSGNLLFPYPYSFSKTISRLHFVQSALPLRRTCLVGLGGESNITQCRVKRVQNKLFGIIFFCLWLHA